MGAPSERRDRPLWWTFVREVWNLLTYIGLMFAMIWAAHDDELAWVMVAGFLLVVRVIEEKRR